MTSDEFRRALHARPFRPFTFTTSGGQTYSVPTPDMAWHPPSCDVVAVAGPARVSYLDIEDIAGISFIPDPPGVQGRAARLRRLRRAEPFIPFVLHTAD
jgi:hypothetical protein